MHRDYFRHDDSRRRRGSQSTNLFWWSIAILILTGIAFAAWIGSFYIFGQPERPASYRILKKLHKVDPIKRFELTAAPAGEFLTSKQLYDRYIAMSPTELSRANAELIRNYIRNYQSVRGLVTYVVGRFNVMDARDLTPNDLFTTGMIALTNAADHGETLMEHVYPADSQSLPVMKQTLVTGLEIKLERTHDLSAVIHAERLPDGRIMITAMPLLYGSYTVARAPGTFTLEPPADLNLEAGWPLFTESDRTTAEARYRERVAPIQNQSMVAGLPAASPPPAKSSLIRVEPAQQVEAPKVVMAPTPKPTATPKGKRLAKNKKATPTPAPVVVSVEAPPAATNNTSAPPLWPPPPKSTGSSPMAVAANTPAALAPSDLSAPTPIPNDALASTAGGGVWKTFPPGKMPVGRLIQTSDLSDLAVHGLAGERVYLRGQFVVNFTESSRAVMRPKTRLSDAVLHPLGGGQSVRIVVEFPAGRTPPSRGTTVNRDEARPYEITEVRKQSDGQLNVFVREIME